MPTLFLAIGAMAMFATACGDDDDDTTPDARVVDGATPDAPDGEIDGGGPDAPPAATRAGTLAVSEVRLTSPDAVGLGIGGQAISFAYSDLTTGGVAPAYADKGLPTTGCSVFIYTVGTDVENPLVDEGDITVGSPAKGESGIIDGAGDPMPNSTCTFNPDLQSYNCLQAQGQGAVAVTNNGNGTATYAITDLDVSPNRKGMVLSIGGFTGDFAANNGNFPIVANIGGPTLIVANAAAVTTDTPQAAGYGFLVGASPIPGGVDFLTDGVGEGEVEELVHITKEAGTTLPAFDELVRPNGEGFTLEGTTPDQIPTNGDAVTFSCGENCGPTYSAISGIVISGRTTSAAVPAHPDYYMPPTEAMVKGDQYATFQCAFIGQTSATIPAEAMALIMGTNPTRIETRIFNFGAKFIINGPDRTNLVIGHGVIGHTTVAN